MKKPARHSLLIAGLASCALGTQAFADNEAYTLGQIEVAGSQQADVAEKSTTVWRISAEDIERRGARTLDEALAQIPGLNIRTGGEGSPRIDMRGQRTRQIKLLVNGIPVNSNADGQFNPALIPVTQIDEIVVRSATSSVLYGEGGTAGIINVITRRGNADHTTANVDARFGTNASRAVSASIGGQAGALDWFISADHQEHGDTRLSTDYVGTAEQPRGKRRNSDLDSTTITGNFGYQVNRDLKIGLGINAGEGSQGKPPGIYPSTDVFAQVPRYERYDNISQLSAQLSADWAITDRTRLRGWIYASQLRQDERRFDGSNYALLQSNRINGGFDKTSDSRSLGYHLQVEHLATDRLTLSAAIDTRRDSYGENGRIRDVAAGGGGGGGGGG
ncbi:TonB-dependent receptor plug domain-containing protein, partial [Herminiimonas contaminans]